ncbi:MAG: M20/M25/M40 family metallo-hydrolase, partial [Candidatus Ranarchaeia archaeon]
STLSKKTILFYDHYDVQPPDPVDEWDSPPFELSVRIEEEKGRIYGRGVADNKGDLVSRIALIKAFLDVSGDVPVNAKFVIEGEEEIGSPRLSTFVQKYRDRLSADFGVWEFGEHLLDGRPKIFLGVKGNQYLSIRCDGPRMDVHSSKAPIIMNPAWRLIRALLTLIDEKGRIMIDKFYDKVLPVSEEELKLIDVIPFDEEYTKRQYGLKKFWRNLSGPLLLRALKTEPTCTICGLRSGFIGEQGTKTIIPSYAVAKLDIRIVPEQKPADVMSQVRQHLDKKGYSDLVVTDLGGLEPAKTSFKEPFVTKVIESAKQVFKKSPVIDPISEASGPLYLFRNKLDVPFVGIGVAHSFSGAHSPNENIIVDNFVDTIKWLGTLLLQLDDKPTS